MFTWSNSDHTQVSRIDRVLVSKSLSGKVSLSQILPCVLSDHDFVTLEISLNCLPNCKNVWKFNSLLLSDPEFKQLMTNKIEKGKLDAHNFSSLGEWWDDLDICISKLSIDFSIRKHKIADAKRAFLMKQLIRAKCASFR